MRVTGNNDPERRARRTKRMKLHKIWHGAGRGKGGGGEQSFFVEIPCLQNWRIEIQKERSSTTCFAPLRVNIHRRKNIHDHSEARKIEGIPMDGKLQWTLERGPRGSNRNSSRETKLWSEYCGYYRYLRFRSKNWRIYSFVNFNWFSNIKNIENL